MVVVGGGLKQLPPPLAIHKRLDSRRALSITEHFIITRFGGGKQMNAIINVRSRRNIFLFTLDQLTVVIRRREKKPLRLLQFVCADKNGGDEEASSETLSERRHPQINVVLQADW